MILLILRSYCLREFLPNLEKTRSNLEGDASRVLSPATTQQKYRAGNTQAKTAETGSVDLLNYVVQVLYLHIVMNEVPLQVNPLLKKKGTGRKEPMQI